MLAVNLDVGNIVLKHGGNIDLEKDCVSIMFGLGGSCPQAIVPAPVSTQRLMIPTSGNVPFEKTINKQVYIG